MKFLVHNYGDNWNTQPLYINTCLNKIPNIKSEFFDRSLSFYDNFDKTQPDVFITSLKYLNNDLISYIEENPKKISMLGINVKNANEDIIKDLSEHMSKLPMKVLIFGPNQVSGITNYLQIIDSADIFLSKASAQSFKINKLIFVDSKDDIQETEGTFHYTSINEHIKNDVDFLLNIYQLSNIFPNYEKIIFKNSKYFDSQLMFNAIYSGTKVVFDTQDDITDRLQALFKGQKFFSAVSKHHTCWNRVKSLLSGLSLHELAKEVDTIIDGEKT